jgi:transposase
MARYKHIDTSPRFLAVDLEAQLLPGTLEHALNHLLDHEIDLSGFDARFNNDDTGASAYPPAMLLKVVLLAYSRGIVSSRAIERACREHVTFIALSGDTCPHFTTIAAFVSGLGELIGKVFQQVLLICDAQGLIGREMFAIDGVKLPSNASKERSGTRADFAHQAQKMEAAVQTMLARHRESDAGDTGPSVQAKEAQRIERLQREARRIREWLSDHPEERKGSRGTVRKSNRTDNESAKMATSKGVIQGYTGVAAVDAKHQVIVEAQAHGTGSEQELLLPTVAALEDMLTEDTLITADAGYHSEANLAALAEMNRDALIPDNGMRARDERFIESAKYKQEPDPLHDKSAGTKKASSLYGPQAFKFDRDAHTCVCPAGQPLHGNGRECNIGGYIAIKFRGSEAACVPCTHRDKCLRTPDKTKTRQVAFFIGKLPGKNVHTERMKQRIDSAEGRALYGRRFATVEPVFANLRHNKQLNRFTLRGQTKVDGQWKLFALVHNIEKLAHHGYAQ